MNETPIERQDQSAWTKLRRAKIVQWGIAYAAGAWVVLQGLAYVTATFHWPEQIQQLTTLALLIGLPIVLVLAWYHGDRGQQRVSGSELVVLTLLLLAGGGLLWLYTQHSASPTATTAAFPAAPTTAATDARPSIAVLPFENRSRLEDDTFFVDGMHDDILTQLSKVGALRVISRTSVEQFRNTKLPMKTIAGQLGVSKILEGGVQRAGDRVRINVQLIDAGTDTHLWAESYDRELSAANIFAIQSEVAAAIAGALKAKLTPSELERVNAIPTWSLQAWEAYQRGKQRMAGRTSSGLADAENSFRQAIALDTKFALAWVGLADTLVLQVFYATRPKDNGLDEAEKAATRALELDSNLAEAWATAGNIANNRRQHERGEEMLQRAISINANYATAHMWLSNCFLDLGRRDEALAAAERAVVLDPLSAILNAHVGQLRMEAGRFDDALAAYKWAIKIDPAMAIAYAGIGDGHARVRRQFDVAIPWYVKAANLDPGNPELAAAVAEGYWDLGDYTEAKRWLERTLAMGQGTAYTNALATVLYQGRGNEEAARRHAQLAAALDPVNVYLLANYDVRKGDYATARARYLKSYPELFGQELPAFSDRETFAAVELALVLQHTGEVGRAKVLLDRSQAYLRTIPRLGLSGFGISDVTIHALRGETVMAVAKLREAEQAGWRGPLWRYYRDFDPNLASIRNEPEFKAVFADIERDMAQQRARLAARPKDAPLDLGDKQ